MIEHNHIVFFDGVCNLCNNTVDFLMRHNKDGTLKFSSLQSEFASQFLTQYSIDLNQLSTIYFYANGQLHKKSKAAFNIAQQLNAPYRYLNFFSFLPEGISNFFYDLIAKNRYRLFGKKETCRIPTEAEVSRFLA